MQKLLFLSLFSFAVCLPSDRDVSIGLFSSANNKSQEDCARAIKKEGITFLGVYDGHGGWETASVLERDLHKSFFESIARNNCSQGKAKVKDALCESLD